MLLILLCVVAVIILIIANEVDSRKKFGFTLDDAKVVEFLKKNLHEYDRDARSAWSDYDLLRSRNNYHLPYIQRGCSSLFHSWHIDDYGRIKRGSPADKIISGYFDSLEEKGMEDKLLKL